MSVGYPHLGGYNSGYPSGKGKGDMYDADGVGGGGGGRGGFMGGPGMGRGGPPQGPGGGAKIMIANINDKINRLDLEERFSKYGKVTGIQMQGNSAFLMFDREDSAIQATRMEHATLFKGCRIEVSVVSDKGMGGGPQGPRGGPIGGDMGDRMSNMSRSGRRSPPTGDRGFRDRPQRMMGRDDQFRDEMPGMGFDEPYSMKGGFPRGGMDGEPFPKNPRFDPYMAGSFGRNEPNMPVPPMDPYLDTYPKSGPGGPPPMPGGPKPNDCEIIVINKNQQSYAESVEHRLRNLGLTVDLLFLREEGALTHTIDDIGRRGTLFAVVIAQQHEAHGSLTLNILQGNPQEHRNMPLDDALKLIARSFHEFVQNKKKLGTSVGGVAAPPPMDREIRLVLTLLLDGKYVTANELERLINYLKERREKMLGSVSALQGQPSVAKAPAIDDPSSKVVPAEQQDLQQRILNILGSTTPGPASTDINLAATVGNPPAQMGLPGFNDLPLSMMGGNQPPTPQQQQQVQQQQQQPQQQSPSSNTYINFDNPSVQKALDSLIQSGPNLLKNISMTNSPTGNPRGPGPQQKPQGMMGGPGGFNQGYGGGGGGNSGPGVGGMQQGYRHPGNNAGGNNMMGGRPQMGGPNNPGGGGGYGMGRQMRY